MKCIRNGRNFMDVLHSKVLILAENMLLLNTIQAEQNYATFNAIFGFDVNDIKRFKS